MLYNKNNDKQYKVHENGSGVNFHRIEWEDLLRWYGTGTVEKELSSPLNHWKENKKI
jgi:hypothetical protein